MKGCGSPPRCRRTGPASPRGDAFRGALYEIEVTREGPGNTVSLEVDGKPVEGDVAPMAMGRVRVKATLR